VACGLCRHDYHPQILVETTAAAPSCPHWRPVGICLWLWCSPFGCSVETPLKVEHYNPDLVVSAYNEVGGNPWWEIRLTLGLAQKVAVQGLLGALLPVAIDSAGNHNLVFREADAIGHPMTSLAERAGDFGLLCESQTTPFVPYFQSGLDALAWRQEVPEILYAASSIPGRLRQPPQHRPGIGAPEVNGLAIEEVGRQMRIYPGRRVQVHGSGKGVLVSTRAATVTAERLLVSAGRTPNLPEGLTDLCPLDRNGRPTNQLPPPEGVV